jgi:glycosyltransferase involved in cell wall biosynthesis
MSRVLYVVHHHPSVMAGGAETYALELYEQVRDSAPGWEPLLLAGTGPSGSGRGTPHPGTLIEPVGGDPGQYFFHTDAADYDWFLSTARNKEFYTRYLADFLRAYKPDVVHIQHSLFFGFDLVRTVRNVLPHAAIVYTLHEYLPMCFRDGQLLTTSGSLCTGPSPRKCGSCFPDIAPQEFFLRERFIKAQLAEVDRFVCPSAFLLEAYAAWGIPREKLVHEQNGRLPAAPARPRGAVQAADRPRNRFGYFGQFTRYKGADVLLEAMGRLAGRDDADAAELVLHGANLEHAPQDVPGPLPRAARGQRRARAAARALPAAGPAVADGRRGLGRRAVHLVRERAAGDPGGLPARQAGHLQRHRRDGRGRHRRRRRPALPRRLVRGAGRHAAARRHHRRPVGVTGRRGAPRPGDGRARPRPAGGVRRGPRRPEAAHPGACTRACAGSHRRPAHPRAGSHPGWNPCRARAPPARGALPCRPLRCPS